MLLPTGVTAVVAAALLTGCSGTDCDELPALRAERDYDLEQSCGR